MEEMIKSGKDQPGDRMKELLTDLALGCQEYCRTMKEIDRTFPGKTQLDFERHQLCWNEMVRNVVDFISRPYKMIYHDSFYQEYVA